MGSAAAQWSRRGLGVAAGVLAVGCAGHGDGQGAGERGERAAGGRLEYRPGVRSDPGARAAPARRGEFTVETGEGGYAVVHVPEGPGPLRLVVLLHGAGGRPERSTGLLRPYAAEHSLLVVAPKSRAATWDVVGGGLGPDVRTIDALLRRVASTYPVVGHTVAGFSDGASYALSLGLANGDVFDSVIAFSPGFAASVSRIGRPRFFVSHGVRDEVLPIERCSRRLVPMLRGDGYEVTYEEFDGGHEIPFDVRELALDWLGSAR